MKALFLLSIISFYTHIAQDSTELNYILSDFQVTENRAVAQYNPAVSMDTYGNYVIIWIQDQNIYAQQYSKSGKVIGENFKVNDNDIDHIWPRPDIQMNHLGDFMITWSSNNNVLAQLYSESGARIGQNSIVNHDSLDGYDPLISFDGEGNFLIFWIQHDTIAHYKSNFYAQWLSRQGKNLGNTLKINIDDNAENPSLSADANGNIILTWTNSPENNHLYLKKLSREGMALTEIITVNDVGGSSDISIHPDESFIIVWNGNGNIYAQRFTSNAEFDGEKFKVNEVEKSYAPSVDVGGNKHIVIAWSQLVELEGKRKANVCAQRYLSDGKRVGEKILVNNKVENEFSWYSVKPSVVCNINGDFLVTWMGIRDEDPNVYASLFYSNNEGKLSNFKVNDNFNGSNNNPSILVDSGDNFKILWMRSIKSHSDNIYLNKYNRYGEKDNNSLLLNDMYVQVGGIGYYYPKPTPFISNDKHGNLIAVWGNTNDIYAQYVKSTGLKLGNNFKINEPNSSSSHSGSVAFTNDGKFLISWFDYREDMNAGTYDRECHVYAQLFNNDLSPINDNFKVSELSFSVGQVGWFTPNSTAPAIASLNNRNLVISWNGHMGIYAQLISSDGTLLGNNFIVNEENNAGNNPDIAAYGSENFLITWLSGGIYAQKYSNEGVPFESNFKVNDDSSSHFSPPSISSDNDGNIVISWIKMEDYWDSTATILAQRFDRSGHPIGKKIRIAETNYRANTNAHDTKLFSGRIYTVWTDNRDGENENSIWANVLDWNNPYTNIEFKKEPETPSTLSLSQNYPNPFNPTTTIKYSIPTDLRYEYQDVRLIVYDLLGREVATIVNAEEKPGNYEVVWDASNQTSGIYFYQLTAGEFKEVKKMVLMK